LKVGAPAHLVVLRERSILEALRNHDAPLFVVSHGALVDMNKVDAILKR
jgi:cytosine deaminase